MAFRYFKDGAWVDPNKVPTGGSAGEVLSKTSATDYAAAWVQPGQPMPPPVVGNYLVPDMRGSIQNTGMNNNEMQATAVYVPRSVTVDTISVFVTVSGSAPAEGRLGIYSSNANGFPDDLIVDAGLYDATTTGTKNITLSPAVTLPQGVVFLVNCRQSANAFQVRRFFIGSGVRRPLTTLSTSLEWGSRQGGVSGAFPASWTGTLAGSGEIFVGVKIASIL